MIGGNIDLGIDSMTTTFPFAQSGAVRALAVTTPQRSASIPNLPTVAETLPGYEATAWQGVFAPAGTPRPIVDRLAEAVKAILERPDVADPARRRRRRAGPAAARGIRRLHPRRARQVEGGGAEVRDAHRMTRRRRPAIE